jgi:hypothetical protein
MMRHLVQTVPFNHRDDGQTGYEAQMESVMNDAVNRGWTLGRVWQVKEDLGPGSVPRVTITLLFERAIIA